MKSGGWQAVVDAVAWEAARRRRNSGAAMEEEFEVREPGQTVVIGEDWEDVRKVCDGVVEVYRQCDVGETGIDPIAAVIVGIEETITFDALLAGIV
jgi:hypothetical protein